MSDAWDHVGGDVVEDGLQGFGEVGGGGGEAGAEVVGLDLGEDRVGFDLGVVVGNEVDHLVSLFAEVFGV